MAEIKTDEAARRKRRRTLIGWLAVTAVLVLAFALVPRLYAPDKDDISRRIVEACIQNMPAVPQWQADLARYLMLNARPVPPGIALAAAGRLRCRRVCPAAVAARV